MCNVLICIWLCPSQDGSFVLGQETGAVHSLSSNVVCRFSLVTRKTFLVAKTC